MSLIYISSPDALSPLTINDPPNWFKDELPASLCRQERKAGVVSSGGVGGNAADQYVMQSRIR